MMKWTVQCFLLLLVCSIPVYGYYGSANWVLFYGNLAQIAGLVFAFFSFIQIQQSYSRTHALRKAWGQLALGVFFWLVGQFLEIYCELVLNLIAYGTVADALWVVGYFPMLNGMRMLLIHHQKDENLSWRTDFKVIYLASGVAYGGLFLFLILPQLRLPYQDFAQTFLDFFYPTFDFILILLCVILLRMANKDPKLFQFALLLAIAFTLTLIGDSVLSLVKDFNSILYLSVDVFYFSCYFSMAIAAQRNSRVPVVQHSGSVV